MGKLFMTLGLPAIVGMLILQVYNLTDAIFVGQFVSKEAVGAIGISYIPVLINQFFFILLGTGGGVLFAHAFGEEKYGVCEALMGNTILFCGGLSLLLGIVVYFGAEPLVSILGAEGEIADQAAVYLKILVFGMPVLGVTGGALSLMRSEGQIRESSFYLFVSIICNIALDFVCIVLLDTGIAGAAIATVIAQVIGVMLLLLHYGRGKSVVKLPAITIDFSLLPGSIKNGSGQGLMHLSGVVSMSFLFHMLSRLGGENHIIVLTASLRVWEYFLFIILGASFAMQSIVGINLGAGNTGRVKEAFRFFTLFGITVSTAVWFLFMLLPGMFLSWFIQDTHLIAFGRPLFRAAHSVYFLTGAAIMISMFFAAIGRGYLASVYVFFQQVLFFFPLLFILPMIFGVRGVWYTLPGAGVLSFCVELLIFYFVWKVLPAVPEIDQEAVAL